MSSIAFPRNLTQVGTQPSATLQTLRDALEGQEGGVSAQLLGTLKSYYSSPVLPGGYAERFNELVMSPKAVSSSNQLQWAGSSVYASGVQEGVRTGLDFASVSKLSSHVRRCMLGPYYSAYELACRLIQRDEQEIQRRLERLSFSQPGQLQEPMLCSDGYFYEKYVVLGSVLESEGAICCGDYPNISPAQWAQLGTVMPQLHAHVGDLRLLTPLSLAWLQTGLPFEGIADSDLFVFYRHTREAAERTGRDFEAGPLPLPYVLQTEVLKNLPKVARNRWLEMAELVHAGQEELVQMQEAMPAAVAYLADELTDSDLSQRAMTEGNTGLPNMPLSVRLGLVRLLSTTPLNEAVKIAVCHAAQVLCSHTVSMTGRRELRPFDQDACSLDVAKVARTLAFMSGEERMLVVEGAEEISGSKRFKSQASFQDVLTIVEVLVLLPRSIRKAVIELAQDDFTGRHAAHRLWDLLDPIQTCQHVSTAPMLSAARRHATGLNGTVDGLVRYMRIAAEMPEARVDPTSNLLAELLTRGERGNILAPLVFETLGALREPEQQILRQHRSSFNDALMAESATVTRIERLMDLDLVKAIIGQLQQPVVIDPQHLPALDEENVMAAHRLDSLQEDMRRLQRRFGQINRRSMGETHLALRAFLQSSAVRGLDLQLRAGSNERANALRALALIENTPAGQQVDVALMAALVWTAINAHGNDPDVRKQREADNMRHSLATALAQCIEDDGHSVCFWGQGQRMVSTLGGYGFQLSFEENLLRISPNALLVHLGSEFQAEYRRAGFEEPSRQQVDRFVRQATSTARLKLQNEQEQQDFGNQLQAMLNMNEWQTS